MPRGVSLQIGVNAVDPGAYAGWTGDLNACEADAESMQEIAAGREYSTTILLTPGPLAIM
jgi:hypothetical protein